MLLTKRKGFEMKMKATSFVTCSISTPYQKNSVGEK